MSARFSASMPPSWLGRQLCTSAEDRSSRPRFRKGFDPLNVGVLGAAGHFVSAHAVIGAESAIGVGIAVDQIVVSLLECVPAGRALIVGADDHLFARSAAIRLRYVEMHQVLRRGRSGVLPSTPLSGRLVVDVFDARDVAQEEQRSVPVHGTDGRRPGATAGRGRKYARQAEDRER